MLPDCDVLILDCEGAEIEIIDGMEQRPRTMIVESHGFLDSPESAVLNSLEAFDYYVDNKRVEYEQNGIYVLTAHKK
jgi:hypothetical protein